MLVTDCQTRRPAARMLLAMPPAQRACYCATTATPIASKLALTRECYSRTSYPLR